MVARLGGLALVVLLVAGCGGGGAPPGVELVFRHSRMPGQDDPLPRLLRGFEREHPGVRVTHEPLPWTADVQHQFYVINLEGRAAGFDVLMVDVIWTAEFARAGWLLDLTDRWPAAERGEHFEATVATAMLDGRVWAVPWVMNVGLLYYRSDLLDASGFAPPRSYEELAQHNDLWGIARFSEPGSQERCEKAGVHTVVCDLAKGDFSQLPDDFDYLLHLATFQGGGLDYDQAIRVNAEGTGLLMQHCRKAKAALVVSTFSTYKPNDDPHHPFAKLGRRNLA